MSKGRADPCWAIACVCYHGRGVFRFEALVADILVCRPCQRPLISAFGRCWEGSGDGGVGGGSEDHLSTLVLQQDPRIALSTIWRGLPGKAKIPKLFRLALCPSEGCSHGVRILGGGLGPV